MLLQQNHRSGTSAAWLNCGPAERATEGSPCGTARGNRVNGGMTHRSDHFALVQLVTDYQPALNCFGGL
jgi:hypothetical protein